jgi:hypothetical protein
VHCDGGKRRAEEIAVFVEEDAAERRDGKRGDFQGPSSMLAGPGADSEGDPASPEANLGAQQKPESATPHTNFLAECLGLGPWLCSGEQPHGYLRHAMAHMQNGAMTRLWRQAENGRDLPISLAGKAQKKPQPTLNVHDPEPRFKSPV